MFSEGFPEDLRPFIPNKYAKAPTLLGTVDRYYFNQNNSIIIYFIDLFVCLYL